MTLRLEHRRVLVLGLGHTGLSALRWLHSQGARLSVADTRLEAPNVATVQVELPQVQIHLGAYRAEAFAQAEVIVISPGVPLAEPLVQAAIARGVPVVGDVELFAQFRHPGAQVIAITGANGKSTVTTLVGEMCQAAGLHTVVAGNIGLPVLDTLLDPASAEPDIYVLELSSFQLETTSSLRADAATVLNLSEDHLDRYQGMPDYAAAKARIFQGCKVQVLNRDDAASMGMVRSGPQRLTFGNDLPASSQDFGLEQAGEQTWLVQGSERLLSSRQMLIAGAHNASNALAALALCHAIGLPQAPLLQALRQFKGLPHRVQWVAEIDGVSFYDDSKGTNVGATCAALAGLPQKVVLIAGGEGKGQDFAPLQAPVARNARAVVLIGRDAPFIEAAIEHTEVPLHNAASLEQAVTLAFAVAQPGDAVLLSPACASFDMFRNYEHRAEVFVAAVQQLQAQRLQPQRGAQ